VSRLKQNSEHREFFAKGKRGIIYKQGKTAIKVRNPCSDIDTIPNEAKYLRLLNKKGIGPKFISYKKGELKREFIEGERILDYFKKTSKNNIIKIIKNIFEQCKKMDELKVNKKELTNPYKDIIIRKNKPVLIDFERCVETKKPKNVTQLCQFLIRQNTKILLENKGIKINREKLLELAREYKHTYNKKIYDKIIKEIS
jgi:predicted Ser/Thr protein kinase